MKYSITNNKKPVDQRDGALLTLEKLRLLVRPFLTSFRKEKAVIFLISIYIAITWSIARIYGLQDRFSVLVYPQAAVLLLVCVGAVAVLIAASHVILVVRPEFPVRYLIAQLRTYLGRLGFIRPAIMIVAFAALLSSVSSFKTLIPALIPYRWDAAFYDLEQVLYGDRQAWQWLQPWISAWNLSQPINVAYNFWFFLIPGVLLWQILEINHWHRRRHFLVAFVLSWALNGSMFAVFFSSAGPCYYGRLFPGEVDPYAPLMTYLASAYHGAPVWAINTQNYLWQLYQNEELSLGSGITAMPSMHVALAWLTFLLFRRINGWLGAVALLYAGVILVGSVHLGWHYSVDGYFSILTTSLIWIAVGRWYSRRQPHEEAVPAFQEQ